MTTTEERFFAKVKQVSAEPLASCWEWQSTLTFGYGYFSVKSRNIRAHRWAYEFMVAEIPPGLFLDHLCENRRCVNPWHLEPVTNQVNIQRHHDRHPVEYCKRGLHRLADDDYRRPNGLRRCLPCATAAQRERRQKAVAA